MSSGDEEYDVYSPEFLAMLQSIWGDGFLAPGGTGAVDTLVRDIDVSNKTVLDIGSALGGPAFHLVEKHNAKSVVGIELQEQLVEQAREAAQSRGLDGRVEFKAVRPGPLLFADETFDIVFSKDSIIHVADKIAMVEEIKRVLVPGGCVVIGDWFSGHEPLSPEAEAWVEATGLTFTFKPIEDFAALFVNAGFINVRTEDRNAWYVELSKRDVEALKGEAGRKLAEMIGEKGASEWLQRSTRRSLVAEQGHLRPGNVWANKPS